MADKNSREAIIVGFVVALVCSILVSTAAVILKPLQDKNRSFFKKKNIIIVSELIKDFKDVTNQDIENKFIESVIPVVVDLKNGVEINQDDAPDLLKSENYDYENLLNNKDYISKVPDLDTELDAGIGKIPTHIQIYYILSNGVKERIILPIIGKGLWSTMYGFIALDFDCKTIKGITFYQHGETPGLGGEIENADWQEGWKGKLAYDENWQPMIKVLKGKIAPTEADPQYKVDGLSGATLTSNGVTNTVRFWLGDDGYKKFLMNMLKENKDE